MSQIVIQKWKLEHMLYKKTEYGSESPDGMRSPDEWLSEERVQQATCLGEYRGGDAKLHYYVELPASVKARFADLDKVLEKVQFFNYDNAAVNRPFTFTSLTLKSPLKNLFNLSQTDTPADLLTRELKDRVAALPEGTRQEIILYAIGRTIMVFTVDQEALFTRYDHDTDVRFELPAPTQEWDR
jgi:hypothetical protein